MNSSELFDFGNRNHEENILVLQPVWVLVKMLEPWLKVPFFPMVCSFVIYFSFCLPFLALDFLGMRFSAVRKSKLHPQTSPTLGMVAHCLTQSIYQHLIFVLPATTVYFYWKPLQFPPKAPELPQLLLHVFACLLIFDFLFFLWHVLHHKVPWLYKTFHKVHHHHISTFALATQYSSTWELMWQGLFTVISAMLINSHPFEDMVFFVMNVGLSVEDHTGYDLPWSTHRLVPWGLYGGAPHHDLHHLHFKCNYAPYFKHWDRIFGTLCHAGDENSSLAKINKD
ncbi:hypothetical protein JRQ81_017193 [Phrynocephalus forsythii]|uniref:Fatty acid hydroxylase domain-containing protein n=1 Tax=Phrynocephalus forsythii TaxID=171643 RepID=A0A9Q0XQV3_9SAUR|nr:hypothetical protein JRQ81_017193 [Phrynocephalus forsythii]